MVQRRVPPQASEMLTKLKSGQGLLTLEASSLWWSLADRNVVPRKLKTQDIRGYFCMFFRRGGCYVHQGFRMISLAICKIGDKLITQTSHGVVNKFALCKPILFCDSQ